MCGEQIKCPVIQRMSCPDLHLQDLRDPWVAREKWDFPRSHWMGVLSCNDIASSVSSNGVNINVNLASLEAGDGYVLR